MRRILAIAFSVLLLASNVNLTMATHYCGGKAVINQLQLGQIDLGCGMMDDEPTPCEEESSSSDSFNATSCCENIYQTVDVENEFSPASKVQLHPDFVVAFIAVVSNLFDAAFTGQINFPYYFPPPLEIDRQVLFQSFLI